jgi:hypothetical protein
MTFLDDHAPFLAQGNRLAHERRRSSSRSVSEEVSIVNEKVWYDGASNRPDSPELRSSQPDLQRTDPCPPEN